MEAQVYNQSGKEAGNIKLPEKVFNLPWNESLVHQVAVGMQANERTPIAHTKNRGEVSGGGKKPWRQKGTGRARHGSRRSPIWVGGGITHGPRNERDYSRKINKKMKNKALFIVLSKKLKDNEIIFVDELNMKEPKTKQAREFLQIFVTKKDYEKLSKKKNAAYIALENKKENVKKSFDNFGNVEVGLTKDLNILDLLKYKFLIMTDAENSLKVLSARNK